MTTKLGYPSIAKETVSTTNPGRRKLRKTAANKKRSDRDDAKKATNDRKSTRKLLDSRFPIYSSKYTEKGANNLYLNNIRTKEETTPDIQSISTAETTLDMTVTGFLCRQIVNQRYKITAVNPKQKKHTRLEAKLTLIQK